MLEDLEIVALGLEPLAKVLLTHCHPVAWGVRQIPGVTQSEKLNFGKILDKHFNNFNK